jgi:ribosomal protein S18 acetylase RimI-like enzyme
MTDATEIRRAVPSDIAGAARLAAELVRLHHRTDAARFYLPERLEEGYSGWLSRELTKSSTVILIAARNSEIVGYAYGRLEERDYMVLLDRHGAFHDLFVTETARQTGIGRRLARAMLEQLEALGAPRIVLSTMAQNEPAQRLFTSLGFRPTMLEMTRERSG